MTSPPTSAVPTGWSAEAAHHYTSYGPCTPDLRGCSSLSTDLASGALRADQMPVAMYDDENWRRTPEPEKAGVCSAMSDFTRLAHENGLRTIMAPDQNLASPGIITTYQGGESQNWQTYLRLGLGTCAAASGTDQYHIMSQPFQTPWCGGQGGACEGSEADFTNFVTQAALQAQAIKPDVRMTSGLSTNPRYNVTPQAMYQNTLNARRFVDGIWLNVAGNPSNPGTAVQYLELLSGLVPHYLGANGNLTSTFPEATTPAVASLAEQGGGMTFMTSDVVAGGTVIPAGTYKFEPWTDGSSGSATLGLEVGYCRPPSCVDRTPIISPESWRMNVPAHDQGVVGNYTTENPTVLPSDGPYRVYVTVHVQEPGAFNLLYNADRASTNLALPRNSADPARARSSVVFPGRGARLAARQPNAQAPATFGLDRRGGTATFTTDPVLRAGDVIPEGAWQFQYWTDGTDGSATVNLQAGYCTGACTDRHPVIDSGAGWQATVSAGARGAATPGGAFTTTSPTPLPSTGGPYRLYWTVTVDAPAGFDLLYDSASTATNVATPLLIH
ncbi:MAG: hypothetical protein GEV28_29480 [Actinophytocola sp.]|uniref:hypothetical protein n=1 Tax=Actinophytocola sp. TaxID=1872138 RepID=UPI00132321B7|nr:hypothetical protein [Actinophytocola sp.]MPZ84306.1 hypothetical protein [Actinophytocola sp.]